MAVQWETTEGFFWRVKTKKRTKQLEKERKKRGIHDGQVHEGESVLVVGHHHQKAHPGNGRHPAINQTTGGLVDVVQLSLFLFAFFSFFLFFFIYIIYIFFAFILIRRVWPHHVVLFFIWHCTSYRENARAVNRSESGSRFSTL